MSLFQKSIDGSIAVLEVLRGLEAEFDAACRTLVEALEGQGKILVCGNGGSAADSIHFTTELLCRFIDDRKSLPAVSLTTDGSFLTAAGNDYGFERIFSRQVEGLGRKGDVLVAFSTSGNSANIFEALKEAKARGLRTIGLLGRDGGVCAGQADVELVVPSQETARIQEAHGLLIHAFCSAIEDKLFGI